MRNPSPPPQSELENLITDRIGDTLFSKKWVLELLLKLFKHDVDDIYLQEKVDQKGENPLELLEKVEKDVCDLWDMSTNHEVANFLFDNEVVDILMDVLEKTNAPRLMEICLGIFGNLVCVNDICLSCSSNTNFRESMLSYLSVSDAPSLVELTRMLLVCVNNADCCAKWLQDFQKHSDEILEILHNTLNVHLLEHVLELLDTLFDASDGIINCFASKQFIGAAVESYNILQREKEGDLITTLLHTLQSLSTTEDGVVSMSGSVDAIMNLIRGCIKDHKEDLFTIESVHPFYSTICSILKCILAIKPNHVIKYINEDIYLIETFMDLLEQSGNVNEYRIYLITYLEFIQDFINAAVQANDNDVINVVRSLEKLKVKWTSVLHSLSELKEAPLTILENINTNINKLVL